jgi:hypothetical protein
MKLRHLLSTLVPALLPISLAAADLPPGGYSLFDRLFSRPGDNGYQHDIPYPFESLLQQLEQRFPDYTGDNDSSLVKVLIPRGRSLQRETASPDYYRFPRIVVALDQDSKTPALVKNRLFMGYQEKSQSIEVISYNETAGRFEYQVVEDYAAGKTPRVRYASRGLCLSCHQNAAPIFARPRWRESNFSNKVAERIAEYHDSYHGVSVLADKGDAARFDFATDQAGLFNAYQQVWQDGCDAGENENRNRACRAGLFLAVLQQAIASIPRPRYRSPLIEQSLLPPVRQNWARRWPQGMPVAGSDIDDRDAPPPDAADRLTPQQDPLSLRPPLANWSYKSALRRTIQGIGEQFLLPRDLIELNRLMLRRIVDGHVPRQVLPGDCRLEFAGGSGPDRWINLDCRFVNGGDTHITVEGELRRNADAAAVFAQGKLLLIGNAGWARVEALASLASPRQDSLLLELKSSYQQLAARLWDNRIITGFEITPPASGLQSGDSTNARLVLSDDFGAIEAAIHRMLEDADAGRTTVFDKKPIPGAGLMRSLLEKLGGGDYADFLPVPEGLPQRTALQTNAAGDAPVLANLPAGSPLRVAYRYCAACHSGDVQIPPGFLHGDIVRVEEQIRQCAPRIAQRLSLWANESRLWHKPPMPPPASLAINGIEADWWRVSAELESLRSYIQGILSDDAVTVDDGNHERLPRCYGG